MSSQPSQSKPIYSLPAPLVRAKVLARPSKINKSPYLADIEIDGAAAGMAHTPALGCCGLIAAGATVWVMPAPSSKSVSSYVIYLVEEADGNIICAHPTVANEVAAGMLAAGIVVPGLRDIRREVVAADTECRFDFCGMDTDGIRTIVEVKSAPIADTVDCMPRDRAKALTEAGPNPPKMAIFPHGNRRKDDVISPRALKHTQTMHGLVESGKARCIMLYLTMRTDVERFTVSAVDHIYRQAVMDACDAGVEIQAWSVRWEGQHAYVGMPLEII
jgi:DNA-binding sugar fermentation-stimulating protein